MHHNYWACALEPRSCNYWTHMPQLLNPTHTRAHALQQEKPLQWEARPRQPESSSCSPQQKKKPVKQWRPSTVKNKLNKEFILTFPYKILMVNLGVGKRKMLFIKIITANEWKRSNTIRISPFFKPNWG